RYRSSRTKALRPPSLSRSGRLPGARTGMMCVARSLAHTVLHPGALSFPGWPARAERAAGPDAGSDPASPPTVPLPTIGTPWRYGRSGPRRLPGRGAWDSAGWRAREGWPRPMPAAGGRIGAVLQRDAAGWTASGGGRTAQDAVHGIATRPEPRAPGPGLRRKR